ncbi:MAG: terpene cyclase/mutase family protein [Pirellulales bacterium]|nr:terpene cyclase/mutase family protein [Pirellulales bacterium]
MALPSWLASLVLHLLAVLLLAVSNLPAVVEPPLALIAHLSELGEARLEESPLNIDLAAEEMEVDEPLEQALATVDAASAAPVDVSLIANLAVEAPSAELLPLGGDLGLLAATGSSIDFASGGYGGRSAAGRSELVRRAGGTAQSEKAVEESLDWLARHQLPDGSWSFDHRYGECQGECDQPGTLVDGVKGATALALLPFLGAGNTQLDGKHQRVVARGLHALVAMMEPTRQGGSFYDGGQMYSHGIASMALCEAYAMTGERFLAGPAQAAVNFICYAQDPQGGGWRYQPRQRGDTSVAGWQVGALKSAFLAGLSVPAIVPAKASYFLDSVQVDQGEGYAYEQQKLEYRGATTAIGLLCRMYLGVERDHPVLQRGVERLAKLGPSKNDAYYNYYATQVVFQYTGGTGPLWDAWNKSMREGLLAGRDTKGHAQGSWAPQQGDHGREKGGRLYATALNCMTLEVYYRLLPIYQEKAFADGFAE